MDNGLTKGRATAFRNAIDEKYENYEGYENYTTPTAII
jgi:hypothetical protein